MLAGGEARGASVPAFYSHYWIAGVVSLDAVPAANRQVKFYYRDPSQNIATYTDAQGRYRLNAFDLQYFHGTPLILRTENYNAAVSQLPGESGKGTGSVLLKTAQGYVDQFFDLFTSRERPKIINKAPVGDHAAAMPTVMIEFSRTMEATSIPRAVKLPPTLKSLGWSMSKNNSQSIFYFEPNYTLQTSSSGLYWVTVTMDASDESGNPLDLNYKWSFSIANSVPTVISIPGNGDTDVARSPTIKFKFSEAMDRDTVNPAVTLPAQGAPWTYYWGTSLHGTSNTIYFNPTRALNGDTDYTIGVGRTAKNPSGEALYADYKATFHTTSKFIGPKIIDMISGNEVPPTAQIWVIFSEPIDPNTLPANMDLKDAAGSKVPGRFSWDSVTCSAHFYPDKPLVPLGQYLLSVRTGITDLAGYNLLKPETSRLIIADLTGPQIGRVWFDGRAFVENDIISSTAQITAEVSDPSGLDYSAMTMSFGNVRQVSRGSFKSMDAYSGNRLAYKIYPSLPEGHYVLTIEAFDTQGNSSDWQGKVRVFSGETQIVPGTIPFASPASINPLKAAAAGAENKVMMVYQLTTPGNIDLQLQGISGMVWARRYTANTMGGFAGYNAVAWDGRDNGGNAAANGVYTFRIINNARLLGKGFIIVYQ
jgi:hypothetical protein